MATPDFIGQEGCTILYAGPSELPADGEPGAAVVSIPDVKCGGASGLDGFVGANFGGLPVPGTTNLQIGGRDAVSTYPAHLAQQQPAWPLSYVADGLLAAWDHSMTCSP